MVLLSLVIKRADWPIARQVEFRQDLQTKREHRKEGGAQESQERNKMNLPCGKKGTAMWQSVHKKYGLV